MEVQKLNKIASKSEELEQQIKVLRVEKGNQVMELKHRNELILNLKGQFEDSLQSYQRMLAQ